MASPQLENGYTRIANELLEAFAGIRINGEAWQCLNVILRKTYGFGKKEDAVSLSQFMLITKLGKTAVCRNLNKLKTFQVIIIKKDNGLGNIYSINKDFSSWKPLSKKITIIKKDNQDYQKSKLSLSKMGNTKERKKLLQKKLAQVQDSSANEIKECLDLFLAINPISHSWFGHKTYRKDLEETMKVYGVENVKAWLKIIPKTNHIQFMPQINNPRDLRDKLNKLIEKYGKS